MLQLGATIHSQEVKVSIHTDKTSLEQLFADIEKQTDVKFLYSHEDVSDITVKVDADDMQLSDLLNSVLSSNGLKYVDKENNLIVIEPAGTQTQQDVAVSGVVSDAGGNPIPGVSIRVKGTASGIVSDSNGKYSITVSGSNAVLVFSCIGYTTQEIAAGSQTVINVVLNEDIESIDEVVVVGYGTQRKVTATGAVSKVEGAALNRLNVVNTAKSLQGVAAGITVIDRGGAPGSDDPEIYLRGVGTTGSTGPLILVDGIERSLSKIPVTEIESVSILKDASSTAIYGSRAAHGVILVTTKSGASGRMKLSYNGYVGVQDIVVRPEPISAREYMELINESYINIGSPPMYSEEEIAITEAGTDPYNYPYTNWHDEVFKPSYITQHTLNVTGGNDTGRYMMMFDYLDQPGITPNTYYDRYNYRMKADLNVGAMLRVSSDLAYVHDNRVHPAQLSNATYRATLDPLTPVRYANGNYALYSGMNAVAYADPDVVGNNIYQTDNIIGQVKAEFEPLKDLVFTGVAALNGFFGRNKVHNRNYKFYDGEGNYTGRQWNETNSVYDVRNNSYQMTLRLLANYKKTFAEAHSLNLLYGMEQVSYRNYYSRAERRNLISDALPDVSLGSASSQYSEGYPGSWGINSFFGRLNYSYREKYLLEANIRTDGSSRFAPGNKWGVFPSVSAGWRLSEESFLKDISFINNLKLRASWGQAGNERIGEFLYLSQYGTENVIMNGTLVSGVRQSQMSNPNITWETAELTDIGIDFAFLGNSIFGELDYYSKDTKDILLNLAIPQFIGLSAPPQNVGIVRNSGIEVMLGYRKTKGKFTFSVSGNLAYNDNKWVDRAGDDANINGWNIQKEDSPLNAYYIYQADGLFANEQELSEYQAKYAADPRGISVLKPGDVRFVDVNGDNTIGPDDRQIYSPNIPKLTYGLTFNAEYRGFDLSMFFQGSSGANRFFYGEWYEGPSYNAFAGLHFRDRWTPENQNGNASVSRVEAGDNRNRSTYNTFFMKNVSYLRLKNIQLGYTLPSSITDKIKLDRVRFYLSGSNLLTFSGLDQGLDPENREGRPTDYPLLKIVNLGININF
jgi:TonB-linked SusC/RagA family outer membrane protein